MKTLKIFFYTLLAIFIGTITSCSSDETLDNVDNETNILSPLTVNVSLEDIETRGNLSMGSGTKVKYAWYSDDIIWAYSPNNNWYNKLYPAPVSGSNNYGDTNMPFSSKADETVKYDENETLIVILSGDKEGNTTKLGEKEDSNTLTFNRPTSSNTQRSNPDNALVITSGNDENRFSVSGNPYFLMATCCKVSGEGILSKFQGGTGSINVRGFIPLLRLNIPATSDDDAKDLSKLNYTITLTLKEGENSEGYPDNIKLKYLQSSSLSEKNVFEYTDDPITWGNPLNITLTSDATVNADKSSSIWNSEATTTKNTDKEGHIYIPFPALQYSKISVSVKVEAPASVTDESLTSLCKTYTYTVENVNGIKLTLDKESANKYYNIGDIWTRTSSEPSAAPARIKAGNGWVVTENE